MIDHFIYIQFNLNNNMHFLRGNIHDSIMIFFFFFLANIFMIKFNVSIPNFNVLISEWYEIYTLIWLMEQMFWMWIYVFFLSLLKKNWNKNLSIFSLFFLIITEYSAEILILTNQPIDYCFLNNARIFSVFFCIRCYCCSPKLFISRWW